MNALHEASRRPVLKCSASATAEQHVQANQGCVNV